MRKKTIFSLLIILSLFLMGINVLGYVVNVESVTYPESVREGDILKITVLFDYEYTTSELYGDAITLTYGITSSSDIILDDVISIDVPISETRPSTVKISIATSELGLELIEEDVTFNFMISYKMGKYIPTAHSEWYGVTITNSNTNTRELIYIISGSSLLFIIIIITTCLLIKRKR